MVSGVNPSLLAALQAQEAARAQRANEAGTASRPVDTTSPSTASPDPAVVYAGAGGSPALSSVLSVQDGLNRAASISDVGISAGHAIAGLLEVLRQKIAAAQGAPADQKPALDADYQQGLRTIDQLARSASFQGTRMLDGSASSDLQFKAGLDSDASLSLTPQDFTVGGPVIGLANGNLLGSSDDLASLLGQVDAAGASLEAQLSQMTAQSQQIHTHLGAVSQLSKALSGATTPDLDADGARLMALQVQQALQSAAPGQGVANQGPQALLSLFRSAG